MCMAQQKTDPCRIWWMEDKTKGFRISGLKKLLAQLFFVAIDILRTSLSVYFQVHLVPGTPKKLRHQRVHWPSQISDPNARILPMHHLQLSKPHDMMPFCGNFWAQRNTSEWKQEITRFFPSQQTQKSKIIGTLVTASFATILVHHFVDARSVLTWGMVTSPSPKVGETLSPTVDNGSLTIQISVISVEFLPGIWASKKFFRCDWFEKSMPPIKSSGWKIWESWKSHKVT